MPSFDGANLIITLDLGITTVDAEINLYSAWKEWFKTGGNSKYPLAFRTVAGDGLTPGIDIGAYFFIRNDLGWRIRPPEEDTTIYFNGNIAPQNSALPILIPTIGNYRVLVAGLQPITQNIDTIKDTLEHSTFNGGVYIDAVNGVPGTTGLAGNEKNPVDGLADAKVISAAKGSSKLYIRGDYTFEATDNIDGLIIMGVHHHLSTVTVVGGCSTVATSLESCTIQGALNGANGHITNCRIVDLTGVTGMIHGSYLGGNIVLTGSEFVQIIDCWDDIPGPGTPIINMGDNTAGVNVRGFHGGAKIIYFVTGNASLGFVEGRIILDATCTGGFALLRGVAAKEDNSQGTVVNSDDLVNPSIIVDQIFNGILSNYQINGSLGAVLQDLHDVGLGRWKMDPDTNTLTLYKADGFTVLQAFDLTAAGVPVAPYLERVPIL